MLRLLRRSKILISYCRSRWTSENSLKARMSAKLSEPHPWCLTHLFIGPLPFFYSVPIFEDFLLSSPQSESLTTQCWLFSARSVAKRKANGCEEMLSYGLFKRAYVEQCLRVHCCRWMSSSYSFALPLCVCLFKALGTPRNAHVHRCFITNLGEGACCSLSFCCWSPTKQLQLFSFFWSICHSPISSRIDSRLVFLFVFSCMWTCTHVSVCDRALCPALVHKFEGVSSASLLVWVCVYLVLMSPWAAYPLHIRTASRLVQRQLCIWRFYNQSTAAGSAYPGESFPTFVLAFPSRCVYILLVCIKIGPEGEQGGGLHSLLCSDCDTRPSGKQANGSVQRE